MANRNNNKGGSGDFGSLAPSEKSDARIKGLDNGVLSRRGSTDPAQGSSYGERANLNFPGMLAKGENPNGFRSMTPNGVQTQSSDGDKNSDYKWGESALGNRWGKNRNWDGDMSGN